MKRSKQCRILTGILVLFVTTFLGAQDSAEIRIVYPAEGQIVTAKDSTFIFGSVTPGSRLWINGHPVRIHPTGRFLAYVPIVTGDFEFQCRAISLDDTVQVERMVHIPHRLVAFPVDSLGFDTSFVHPIASSTLRPGDLFEVSVKGTPGCRAVFDIDGVAWGLPMAERMPLSRFAWGDVVFGDLKIDTSVTPGIYTGVYQIQPWDVANDAPVNFHLIDAGFDTVSITAGGALSIDASPVPKIAVLTSETVIARPAPDQAYTWFLPRGVKVWLAGQKGAWHRIQLAEGHTAWIADGSFQELPPGTLVPRSIVRVIRTEDLDDRVRVHIPLDDRVPFHIRQRTNPSSLVLTLCGVWSDTDWIPQDFTDPVISDIRWHQVSSEVYELEIFLNQTQQWGYDSRYNGSTFELDIRRKPRIQRSVFKGLTICIDPGHHPDTGAVGPSGLEERQVNLAVARNLRKMLEKRGATVIMTREEEEGISLRARPRLAAAMDADILISVHFNALPDGVNPWTHNGSSTYYYNPMSSRLARLIHKEVLEELRLPDFGVFYADLALCRPTQMVAVLTEEAFMMIPEQEALLAQPEFQKRCARAIFKGLERFLKENRH